MWEDRVHTRFFVWLESSAFFKCWCDLLTFWRVCNDACQWVLNVSELVEICLRDATWRVDWRNSWSRCRMRMKSLQKGWNLCRMDGIDASRMESTHNRWNRCRMDGIDEELRSNRCKRMESIQITWSPFRKDEIVAENPKIDVKTDGIDEETMQLMQIRSNRFRSNSLSYLATSMPFQHLQIDPTSGAIPRPPHDASRPPHDAFCRGLLLSRAPFVGLGRIFTCLPLCIPRHLTRQIWHSRRHGNVPSFISRHARVSRDVQLARSLHYNRSRFGACA